MEERPFMAAEACNNLENELKLAQAEANSRLPATSAMQQITQSSVNETLCSAKWPSREAAEYC